MTEITGNIELIDLVTLMAGLGALLAFVLVWQAATQGAVFNKRLKLLNERKEALKSGIIASKRRTSHVRKTASFSFIRQIVDKLRLLREENTRKYEAKLVTAGYRSKDTLVIFLFAKLAGPILGGIAAVIVLYGLKILAGNAAGQIASGMGAVLFGFYLPDILVKNTADKRQAAIRKALPDALDLMVICAEAGLTLDASLSRVSREMQRQCEELADELGLASVELGFLNNRRDALDNLAARVPMKAVRSVVATLIQTEKYGTPLANSLRVLSNEFRNERMMKAEEKAARLPAIMTIPLILFILPMLFIIILGPAACKLTDSFIAPYQAGQGINQQTP
ncbi:MAG TPA: type II secretion system F family protein [Sphingomonadales bacterium]|nr:type II secretion system F family protein [Sphingomonadales bacterium]